SNDYAHLVGNPSQFAFDKSQAGAIVNAGNLTVREGQNLTLLGGTTINTGTLSAPGGNITLTAVPGSSLVRVSRPGSLLSLEIAPPRDASGMILPFQVLDLPQLLAGAGVETGLAVGADGNVVLEASGIGIPANEGSAIASGTLDVSSASQPGGSIDILGTQVGAIAASLNASGTNGGSIRIGGDYQGRGSIPNALRTAVSRGTAITADAIAPEGYGGRVIIWADEITGFYGNLTARGAENGGFVEISGKDSLIFQGQVDVGIDGTILFDPANITIVPGNGPDDIQLGLNVPNSDPIGSILAAHGGTGDFVIGATVLENLTGNIELQATNDIVIDPRVSLNFPFQGGGTRSIVFTADFDGMGGGDFIMNPNRSIIAPGSNVTISGANVTVGRLDTSAASGSGGSVRLSSNGGTIGFGNITTNNNSIAFEGPVVLNQNATVSNRNTSGEIRFTQPVNGNFNLDIKVDGGNVTFEAAVGNTAELRNLSIESTGATQFKSSVSAAQLMTDARGTTHLNGDVTTSGRGGQDYGDRVFVETDLSLTGDALSFRDTVSGSGYNLTLQPFDPSQAIAVGGSGGGGSAVLDLSARDLGNLDNGFDSITIGRDGGSGTITLEGNTT
ncbi:MAG: hypothetical protein SVX43_21740, partial [Cyanobacteriota bacterium]|nr:hypothetical protein [Cyanobacteriota bacterium]